MTGVQPRSVPWMRSLSLHPVIVRDPGLSRFCCELRYTFARALAARVLDSTDKGMEQLAARSGQSSISNGQSRGLNNSRVKRLYGRRTAQLAAIWSNGQIVKKSNGQGAGYGEAETGGQGEGDRETGRYGETLQHKDSRGSRDQNGRQTVSRALIRAMCPSTRTAVNRGRLFTRVPFRLGASAVY